MKKSLLLLALLLTVALQSPAQDAAKPKPEDRQPALTPLHIQVVFTEYDGDKKISSLPHSFTVNADERRARPGSLIRDGVRLPITTGGKDQQYTYIDVGTSVDCSATQLEDGRFKLQLSMDRSSILPESASSTGNPAIRQFRVEINPVLKDGQTLETVASTDPLNGHTYRVVVTLNVVK